MPTNSFISQDIGPISGGISAITASDSTTYDPPIRLYVGVTGNVAVVFPDSTAATLVGIVAGMWHPMFVRKVMATGTTATNILGATA